MREIRLSGSEGGGTGNSTGPPYPYPPRPCSSVGAGHARDVVAFRIPRHEVERWPRQADGSGHDGFPGKKTALWR